MIFIYAMFAFCAFCIFTIYKKFGKITAIIYGSVALVMGIAFLDICKEQRILPMMFMFMIFGGICILAAKKAFGGSQHGDRRFERGSSILNYNQMKKILSKYNLRLPFGDYKLPVDFEVKHCFIIGRPGTGKTNALNQMIGEVSKNKLPAVIHDNKGDFVPRFYNSATDYIINPFDQRCTGWNIFNDIKRETDFNLFACSLIPEGLNSEPYWHEVPRKVFAEVLAYCWHANKKTNKDIWKVLSLPVNELAELLKSSGGTSYIDLTGNDKTAANLMSVLLSKCKVFYYMQHIDGDFSVNTWLNSGSGLVFLTNQADIKDTVKPILTLFIDICTSRLLSLPDDNNKRIFFFLDEFGSLARINNIVNLLTLSRSKGGCVFIGIQDIGNIEKLYGKEHRQTIVNACGNSLIFAVEDPDTADFLSKKLGDTEYYETMISDSANAKDMTISTQEQKRNERIVLPSQIQKLSDRVAIAKFADVGIFYTTFPYVSWQTHEPSFIEHKYLALTDSKPTNEDNKAEKVSNNVGNVEFESI